MSAVKIIAIGDNVCDKYLSRGKMYPGGQCVNTCAYAAANGVPSAYLGKFGSDEVAAYNQKILHELGIDISHCRHFEGENGFAMVTLKGNDRVFLGSNKGGVAKEHSFDFTQEDLEYIKGFNLIYTNLNSYIEEDLPFLHTAGVPIAYDFSTRWTDAYLEKVMSGIPEHFSGKLLEVPVGTGILTMPVYQTMPEADITCLDYSPDMMRQAREKADRLHLKNVTFRQDDVGALSYADDTFDIVLSLNGFYAFLDKEAAYWEVLRVLRPGGIFCGCFYVKGKQKRTDWFVRHVYEKAVFFTPPYETASDLKNRLERMYAAVTLGNVKSMAWFICRKAG